MTTIHDTWEAYVSAWGPLAAAKRSALFEHSLAPSCRYRDPLIETHGWAELDVYMQQFQVRFPGGHFVTTRFLAHHDRSLAVCKMRDGSCARIGDGFSYGQYGDHGKLVAMTGFYELPGS